MVNRKDDVRGKFLKGITKGHTTRQTPLYDNSQLWTSDGEPLCICDRRKAKWYVIKGLGFIVQENPMIVQLNFEPAGRPNKEGADGLFYLQERLNVCVVCGKDESYIKKNIIPHEYRKYFPEILKSHQNHDVVLLCIKCHQMSNVKDNILRQKLSDECNAPLANEIDIRKTTSGRLKKLQKAGNALVNSRTKLPASKINYLENVIKDHFKAKTLTDDLIKLAANFEKKNFTEEENDTHGFKVYLKYKKIGLILLEQLWREWFLYSMRPAFLPENWSINHNHSKLKVKMSRYPLDHPLREDYKEALVGTEGYIDIPYWPNSY